MNDDLISRQAAIDEIEYELEMINSALDSISLDFNAKERLRERRGEAREILNSIQQLPSVHPESFVDADKLKRCEFEYINACKIVAHQTPDTRKSDVYDAYAVIKALHPIFGDVEF